MDAAEKADEASLASLPVDVVLPLADVVLPLVDVIPVSADVVPVPPEVVPLLPDVVLLPIPVDGVLLTVDVLEPTSLGDLGGSQFW